MESSFNVGRVSASLEPELDKHRAWCRSLASLWELWGILGVLWRLRSKPVLKAHLEGNGTKLSWQNIYEVSQKCSTSMLDLVQ